MARNINVGSLSVLTTISALGAPQAQAYLSADNLFCSPSYEMSTPLPFSSSTGAGAGKVTFNPFSITRRVTLPKSGAMTLCDFDYRCSMDWSWGETQTPIRGSGSGRCVMSITRAGTSSDGTELFDTEMVSMDASATSADGAVMKLRGRSTVVYRNTGSFSSAGSLSPGGGGPYEITSFFDLYADASVDGGKTWTSSVSSSRMQGTPEPASLAVRGLGALGMLRRRKKQA